MTAKRIRLTGKIDDATHEVWIANILAN
jgi:hypothetical protein